MVDNEILVVVVVDGVDEDELDVVPVEVVVEAVVTSQPMIYGYYLVRLPVVAVLPSAISL